ncbi:hypothetical protein [Microbacterium album]|uniref:Uncharacterized protein n=1 Tax=Microbacterium album TaxID=2053191 RepID=A0A917IF85_9MICO|nr:hypothetical protein [Microbacterium album]GGH43491.1 hypothetical protein GCM10010921_17440 [Microbacterium album]
MTVPEHASPRRHAAIAATWAFAILAAIAVGVFVPLEWRAPWLGVAGGACVIAAFVFQLMDGRAHGFISRVAVAALGGLGLIGALSLGMVLAAISVGDALS